MNWSSDSLILSSWPCTRQSCCWSHSSTCWSGSCGRIIGSLHAALSFEFSLKILAIFLFQSLLSVPKQFNINNVKYIWFTDLCCIWVSGIENVARLPIPSTLPANAGSCSSKSNWLSGTMCSFPQVKTGLLTLSVSSLLVSLGRRKE